MGTGRQDEAQQLVAEIIIHGCFDRFGRAVERLDQRPRDLLVLAFAHLIAPEGVDRAVWRASQELEAPNAASPR
jgi:hypothetical protein